MVERASTGDRLATGGLEWEKSTTRENGPTTECKRRGGGKEAAKRAVTMAASIIRFDAHGLFQHYAPWQVSACIYGVLFRGAI